MYIHDGWFSDGEGRHVHVFASPVQEMKERLLRAWQHHVGKKWPIGKAFKVCSRFVFSPVFLTTHLSRDQVGLLRVLQCGTFITGDTLQHSNASGSSGCEFVALCTSFFTQMFLARQPVSAVTSCVQSHARFESSSKQYTSSASFAGTYALVLSWNRKLP